MLYKVRPSSQMLQKRTYHAMVVGLVMRSRRTWSVAELQMGIHAYASGSVSIQLVQWRVQILRHH